MFKNPQSMIRTVLAVMLMVGVAWFQQRMGGKPVARAPEAEPQAQTEEAAAESAPVSEATSKPAPAPAHRGPKVATGDFDFYVLALSWSPTYCSSDAASGRDGDVQCRSGRPFGFVLHGLWPQNERGYPEHCTSNEPERVPDDLVSEVLKIAPSPKLVQHEWEKHGTCTGLSQLDYFASAAMAMSGVRIPKEFRQPQEVVRITADKLRDAFLAENSSLDERGILATCRGNDIGEVRVCLDKELRPRACSAETLKSHCGRRQARMLAVRESWPRN